MKIIGIPRKLGEVFGKGMLLKVPNMNNGEYSDGNPVTRAPGFGGLTLELLGQLRLIRMTIIGSG